MRPAEDVLKLLLGRVYKMWSSLLILYAFLGAATHIARASAPAYDGKEYREHGVPSRDHDNGGSHHVKCKTLLERKEWRVLTDAEKHDYIRAVKCLQKLPAKRPVNPASVSRFDEFQGFHISIAERVHLAGQFLPWHRHFLKRYELALRSECHYKGAAPYWDWTQDADESSSITGSPIFDPVTGFGGDGVSGTYTIPANVNSIPQLVPTIPAKFKGCVGDGPFANLTLRMGPGKLNTTHCLTRGLDNSLHVRLNSAAVANTTKQRTFEDFRVQLEGQPVTDSPRMHDGGHFTVGGDMSNFYSSPGDPIFYLHHANLDRVWWNWQQMLPHRLYEMTGRSTINPPYVNVTLDFPLIMTPLGPTVPIREVMDIHSGPSCYTYV